MVPPVRIMHFPRRRIRTTTPGLAIRSMPGRAHRHAPGRQGRAVPERQLPGGAGEGRKGTGSEQSWNVLWNQEQNASGSFPKASQASFWRAHRPCAPTAHVSTGSCGPATATSGKPMPQNKAGMSFAISAKTLWVLSQGCPKAQEGNLEAGLRVVRDAWRVGRRTCGVRR